MNKEEQAIENMILEQEEAEKVRDDLREAGRKGGKAVKHRWTEEERDIVRCGYAQTNASAQKIADVLGVTLFAVKGQVMQMGLCKRVAPGKPWDSKQDDKLRELLPKYTAGTAALMMGRTINSVVVRSNRLGLSRQTRDGWYTKNEAAVILGTDHKTIEAFIDSGALKALYHNGKNGKWHIDEKDLKHFIRRYPQELNGRNVDLIQIVELLVGLDAITY